MRHLPHSGHGGGRGVFCLKCESAGNHRDSHCKPQTAAAPPLRVKTSESIATPEPSALPQHKHSKQSTHKQPTASVTSRRTCPRRRVLSTAETHHRVILLNQVVLLCGPSCPLASTAGLTRPPNSPHRRVKCG